MFAVVTEEVGHLLHAHTSNMCRFEPDGTGMVVGAWSTGGVQAVPVGTHVALDGTTVAALIRRSGRPERVDTYEGIEGTTAELLRSLGFRSAVGAPVQLTGRLWGAMMVSTVEERRFADGAEQRIADFAELVALALGNAEAREALAASRARIVEVGDAERRRLERNLHDGAQQQLVTLALTLRLAEAKLSARRSRGARAAAPRRRRAERRAGGAARAGARHPPGRPHRPRAGARARDAVRARRRPGRDVGALHERLPGAVEAAAYYIVAEALTNAFKHAARVARGGARQPAWTAARWSRWPTTASAAPTAARGSGLRGLGDRVEALGGTLELESPAGAGTTLRARIPCRIADRVAWRRSGARAWRGSGRSGGGT